MKSTLKNFRQVLFPAHTMLGGSSGLLANVRTHSCTYFLFSMCDGAALSHKTVFLPFN